MSEKDEHMEPIAWPVPVLRVALHWDGKDWSVADVVRVPSMTLTRSDSGDPRMVSGFWIDALDERGRLRHRSRRPDPFQGMEVFQESGEILRTEHGGHAVDIEALVPDVETVAVRLTRRAPTDRKPSSVSLVVDRDRVRTHGGQGPKKDCGCHDTTKHGGH